MSRAAAGNGPPRAPRCSPAIARVLMNLYRGQEPWGHLSGRSMHGAAGQTERAMKVRGWVEGDGRKLSLTIEGREVAAALVGQGRRSDEA